MNRSVTLPADGGGECGFAGGMETPPQASRRRSRPGCSTAVASLPRHVICAWRLVPRTPRHMSRRSSRSLGCAVAARRLLPLSPVAPLLFASLMPAAAANPSATLQGGLEREAAVGRRRRECCFAKGVECPILASLFERAEGWLQGSSKVIRGSDAPRTTPSLHRGDLFSARASLRPARHRAASPQYQPHREAPPVVASGRSSLPRRPSASHRAGVVGSPLERRCFGYALMSRRPRRLTLRAAFGSLSQTVPRPSARRKGKWRRKPRRA